MSEKEEKPIRVVDRRMFTSDGDLRPDFEPEEPSAPPAAPNAPPVASLAASAGAAASSEAASGAGSRAAPAPPIPVSAAHDAVGEEDREEPEEPEGRPADPRGEFSAIVRSLATTAYSALGLLADPSGARHQEPAVARQMIEWLGVLESKTRNNLSFEESAFLSRVLYELRMAYVEVTRPPGR